VKIKTYSYSRWSSDIQGKGRSLARQTDAPEIHSFIQRHNLEIVQRMTDAGVHSFKGQNFSNTTALGKFLDQIRKGAIPQGSVLMVENLDRFSRDNITDCITRFIEIIKAGVSIGVVAMDLIIDLEQMNNNSMLWNYVSNEFQRARGESKRKSRFTMDTLNDKLARAKAGGLVHFQIQSPTWIKGVRNRAGEKILKDTKDKYGVEWIVDDIRVKTVQRIFKLYLQGESANHISTILNKDNVAGLKNGRIKNWEQSQIKSVLNNRNVLGWCKVMSFEKDDFYPQIISNVDFQKAQVRLKFNSNTRGGSKDNVPNIFRGVMFCECGSAMDVHCKGNGKYTYLQCRKSMYERGCSIKTRLKTAAVEFAIFSSFRQPASLVADENSNIDLELMQLNEKLAKIDNSINRYSIALGDIELAGVDNLKTQLKDAIRAKEVVLKAIQDANAKTSRLIELPKALGSFKDILKGDDYFLHDTQEEAMADYIKGLENWYADYKVFMRELEKRRVLRNLIPSIFERIELRHHDKNGATVTNINCKLIGGNTIETSLIRDAKNKYALLIDDEVVLLK